MFVGQNSATRATLLGRIRLAPTDPGAWSEFVTHYGRKIFAWCVAWGLQDADAWDVTQNVLLNLAVRMRDFRYDPDRSFHAWLRTVTHNAWRNYHKSQSRHCRGSGDSGVFDQLANVAAQDDLARRLEQAFDQETLQEAVARVRLRVEPRTWDAFRLVTQENWSGADAARHLRMKVGTVFVACSRVTRMLRDEVAKLERE
jgi:RNA polymerase sigma factor (sigma-70 family)